MPRHSVAGLERAAVAKKVVAEQDGGARNPPGHECGKVPPVPAQREKEWHDEQRVRGPHQDRRAEAEAGRESPSPVVARKERAQHRSQNPARRHDVAHRLDRLEHEDGTGGKDGGPARGGPRREAHPPSDQVHQHERQSREQGAHQERRGPPAEERARSRQMEWKPDRVERRERAVPRAVNEAQRREGPGPGFGKVEAAERVDRFDEPAARERPRGVHIARAVRTTDREAGVAVEIGAVDRDGRGDQEAARDAHRPIRDSPHAASLGGSVAGGFRQSVSRSRRKTLMSPSA